MQALDRARRRGDERVSALDERRERHRRHRLRLRAEREQALEDKRGRPARTRPLRARARARARAGSAARGRAVSGSLGRLPDRDRRAGARSRRARDPGPAARGPDRRGRRAVTATRSSERSCTTTAQGSCRWPRRRPPTSNRIGARRWSRRADHLPDPDPEIVNDIARALVQGLARPGSPTCCESVRAALFRRSRSGLGARLRPPNYATAFSRQILAAIAAGPPPPPPGARLH